MKVFVSPERPNYRDGFCETMSGELLLPIECDCADELCHALVFVGAETGRSSSMAQVAERRDLETESYAAALTPIFLRIEDDGELTNRELAQELFSSVMRATTEAGALTVGSVVRASFDGRFELIGGSREQSQHGRVLESASAGAGTGNRSGLRLIRGAGIG
jgi:hypothetical protein